MPDWLVSLLKKSDQANKSEGELTDAASRDIYIAADLTIQGVISVLAQLLEQSSSTKYAYLCHPRVQHISKLKREGTSRPRPYLRAHTDKCF